MRKLGCGPLAVILLILIFILGFGFNEGVERYFVHCGDGEEDLMDCIFDATDEEPQEGAVAATGVYTYKDYSVTITMNIPLAGGNVTGSLSGTCEGSVKGTYNGKQGGVITGKMTGVCAPFFVNIPASADFTGTVNKTSKKVPINFTGRGGGFTHEGATTLSY